MSYRAVFVDRDGTMAKDVPYCSRPEDFELFPTTAKAIRLLNEHGFKVIVITNQSGIARGYFTEEMLARIHQKAKDDLAKEGAFVDAVYYCPHHPDEDCDCRKPRPKLILQAAADHHIDLQRSFVVGDMAMDIGLGKAVNCQTILVGSPPSTDREVSPDFVASDILEAAQIILRLRRNPEVSVIVPMYNSRNTILQTLEGLQNQTRADFEVIVVDDGSTDNSSQLVTQFKDGTDLAIKLLFQKNSGPATARNLGVEHSSGKIIIFLDSDCVPPANWLEAMTSTLNGKVVGCGCGYKVKGETKLVARYIDCEIARRHERMPHKNIDTIGSYSAGFLRDVFTHAGGFDAQYTTASGEDFDLAFNIRRMGYELAFTDETFVYHYHPNSLAKYLKQQYGRGYWRVRMYLKNKGRIVKGDSYTGHEAQLQFILSSLAFLSVPLMFIKPYSIAIGFGLLLLSNLPLGLWAFKKEKKLLLLAPVVASLRSLAGTLGVYTCFLKSIGGLAKRKSPAESQG